MSGRLLLLLLVAGLGCTGVRVHAWGSVAPIPSESECRPYIEKALKELSPESTQEAVDTAPSPDTLQTTDASTEGSEQEGSIEGTEESVTTDSVEKEAGEQSKEDGKESNESKETTDQEESKETGEIVENKDSEEENEEAKKQNGSEEQSGSEEQNEKSGEQSEETESKADESGENEQTESKENVEGGDNSGESQEVGEGDKSGESQDVAEGDKSGESKEITGESRDESTEKEESGEIKERSDEDISVEISKSGEDTAEEQDESAEKADQESNEEDTKSVEDSKEENETTGEEQDGDVSQEDDTKASTETEESVDEAENLTKEDQDERSEEKETKEKSESEEKPHEQSTETDVASTEESGETEDKSKDQSEEDTVEGDDKRSESAESQEKDDVKEKESGEGDSKPAESAEDDDKNEKSNESTEDDSKKETEVSGEDSSEAKSAEGTVSNGEESEEQSTPEEDLTIDVVIPEKLRPRDHIGQILKLDPESAETELLLSKTIDITLRELKRLYDTAIQPLEILYKYRDLSNRHFGDPEIFSKPLILFMGPWSGGKSTIINYLLNNEYTNTALRTGAEPSPAYFNILMWGEQEEVLDGTQLAADWTFSGLQKFGQGLLDRLRGLKLKNPLLEKVNIVEIPGILEIRKQVERLFPFNDACQWFIDRADIIFLVYDPSKLDVGPETEAILDQLKGREYQTRIILNKADQVKPEELMRVQGTLIWNISPLMSSSEPPVMYSTSLWSIPYEVGSPSRLLYAQEKAFLKDLRNAIDKRVDNKIASARRFAVRVRNHAKMVDCYLTTYYNHKSFFGNRKKVADDIIEHPQNYHIYEGLSTLTNISRYDLPDPEVYRDFFRLNPVYDFQKLSSTCTYFRGCPINRLDVAIAYDLPELVGKYKRSAESVLASAEVPPKS